MTSATTARAPSDDVFKALADPTRREILALLRERKRSVGELATNFHISRPAVSKHLRQLRAAGLVIDRTAGTTRICELNAAPLQHVDDWLQTYREFWTLSLTRLKTHIRISRRKHVIQTDSSSTSAIVREITIAAPATVVFAALTEPDQITTWWGTDSTYRTTAMDRDLRVGGAWKTVGMTAGGQSFSVGGVYRAIDAPYHLEFTWLHDWGPRTDRLETIVRYDLDERDGVTRLRVTHWGFGDRDARDDHERGWTAVLDLLRAHLEKRPPAA